MPVVHVTISDQDVERLRMLAEERQMTPESLVTEIVCEWLARRQTFKEAAKATLEKNAELYRRLADGPKPTRS